MINPASIWLAESLDNDIEAREALASLVKGCYNNVLTCSKTASDHRVPTDRNTCDAVLHHLFSGSCATRRDVPACHAIAQGYTTSIGVAHKLGSILCSMYAYNDITLDTFRLCCQSIGIDTSEYGRQLVGKLKMKIKAWEPLSRCCDTLDIINCLETLGRRSLVELASFHGLDLLTADLNDARDAIVNHLLIGECTKVSGVLCISTLPCSPAATTSDDLTLSILDGVLRTATKKPMVRALRSLSLAHSSADSISMHRKILRKHITDLRARIRSNRVHTLTGNNATHDALAEVARSWPQRVSHSQKAAIVHDFRSTTSTYALKSFTCASCAERVRQSKCRDRVLSDININVLRNTAGRMEHNTVPTDPHLPFQSGPLAGVLVDPAGVHENEDGLLSLSLCPPCDSALSRKKLPRFALANLNVIGDVPPELKDLTVVEEMLVARCRAKMCVVKLQDHRDDVELPTVQRGMKGHIIVFPQHPERISGIMPPTVGDVTTPICIIFCGSTPPTSEWLKKNARPLVVRRETVLKALQWLCTHNHLYKDVTIDADRISALPEEDVLQYNVEHIPVSNTARDLVSRYDCSGDGQPADVTSEPSPELPVHFESVVITDVDANSPSNQLKAAALRHAKRGGSFIQVPHDTEPLNEFFNPTMFPMIYPSLFPYGIGGFEDIRRVVPIGLENHVKHMLALSDRRFQEHYSFMFVIFNVIQRRKLLLHTSLCVKRKNFESWAQRFVDVSVEAVQALADRSTIGGQPTASTDEERKVLELMKEVKLISANIPGSAASRLTMRNEIRATIMSLGIPSFYITVNPADVYNPIVKYLSGHDIDIDNLMSHEVPTYWEQAKTIARNPCIAAEFFDTYVNAFFSAILRYDLKQRSTEPGVIGIVKAYYGCVEAQGRGSLHCHMVVWVHGGLNCDEIREKAMADSEWKDRLVEFLDETICNVVPADPDPSMTLQSCEHHACSVRGTGMDLNPYSEDTLKARVKDLRNVILECQCHSHTRTCYKHCKPGDPRRCRFDLDESNVVPSTYFNENTLSFVLRHLTGMVNNYCPTISEATQCNGDIKFLVSGHTAKSVLYYVTDYISKTQEKYHVSFGAIKAALKKLGDYDATDTDPGTRGKQTLQKCVYSIISHQELSGQQVASYLKGYGDNYSSHTYRNLYWTAFEKSINAERPSPECYESRASVLERISTTPSQGPGEQDDGMQDTDVLTELCGEQDDAMQDAGLLSEQHDEPRSDADMVTELRDEQDDAMQDAGPLSEQHDELHSDAEVSTELQDEPEDEDVTIATTADGTVVECSTQVHDYRFRAVAHEEAISCIIANI